jgi:hypothetical protein
MTHTPPKRFVRLESTKFSAQPELIELKKIVLFKFLAMLTFALMYLRITNVRMIRVVTCVGERTNSWPTFKLQIQHLYGRAEENNWKDLNRHLPNTKCVVGCDFNPEDEDDTFLRNGNHLQDHTASQCRGPQTTSSAPWEPQTSDKICNAYLSSPPGCYVDCHLMHDLVTLLIVIDEYKL